ncbi:SRPBCC family protein [Jatrophihabitans endophyticus]|uniref:SRPBCC family protein n=1 Tax=Jatrophihabitans endophyticus TaxID=1206085 RepID=UPI0019F3CD8C|nr:SRPBCC family protein [Jatrophihabitans endophyticus]MBE7190799.1 SRPBCC family protein [Jatrophihabitans endophyticus]
MSAAAADPRPLTAEVRIDAAPSAVWSVVSDVGRTGEWSPECARVVAVGGVRRGGFLLGLNRRGKVRWATVSRVTSFDPERSLGWTVLTNRSQWTYRLEPDGDGTRLTETRRTPRGESRFAVWFTERLLGGQQAHDDELEAGMAAGLARIRALVESATATPA